MNELGITEEMVYGDSPRSKSDSYTKAGGRNVWARRYHGTGRRLNPRDRGGSSLFRYDRDPSRSPSPHGYDIQSASHMESASSLQSVITTSIKTEVSESQERLSPGGYSLRSGESQERPSSQTSDHSSQSGVREESFDWSLSQTSHGSRDHVSDRKKTSSDIRSSTSNRLCSRKYQESDSDDTSSRERDSTRKSKWTTKHDLKSDRYPQRMGERTSKRTSGPVADKNPGSDSKDRDKEGRDKNEWWRQHRGHTRRISVSPRRSAKDETDNGEQRKLEESYESDGQMVTLTMSPICDHHQCLHQMPEQSQTNKEDGIQMTSEIPLCEGSSQVQPMDLDTSNNGSPEPEKNVETSESHMAAKQIAQPEHPTKVEQDPDELVSCTDTKLKDVRDAFQVQLQTQYTAPATLFDFERDETPPAEIVEATAQWYRTQNIPPNFDPVSLQRIIQYYQRSVSASDTKIGNSMWPATLFHQGGQQQVTMTSVDNCSTPTCSWNERFLSVTDQCTTNVEPTLNHVSVTNISEEADDTSFPTVQLGIPSYPVGDPNSSHLSGDNKHSLKFSASEVQQQLQVFLNKPRSSKDHFYSPEPASGSLQPSHEVEALLSMAESSSRKIIEHIRNDESSYPSMECTTPNTRNNELAYKNICDTPNRDRSTVDCSNISSIVQPELYLQIPGKSRSPLSCGRLSSEVHNHATLEEGTIRIDPRLEPRGSLDMWPAPVRSQQREQPRIEEHFREDIWKMDKEWSREHEHVDKIEDLTDTVEWMETSVSGCKELDPSWGKEVRRQSRRVSATPAVDKLRYESQPCLTASLTSEFRLYYPHKQESESRNSSPPPHQEYQFQDYTSSSKQISRTEKSFSCELSDEHKVCDPSDDCFVTIAENESFGFFHNRIVGQSPTPRSQSEQDRLHWILDEEPAERVMEEEIARKMICKTNSEGRNTPTLQVHSTIAEPSKDLHNTDKDSSIQLRAVGKRATNVQTIPTAGKEHNAHEYKHLQKSYYKVNSQIHTVVILAIEEMNLHCIYSSRNFVSKLQF